MAVVSLDVSALTIRHTCCKVAGMDTLDTEIISYLTQGATTIWVMNHLGITKGDYYASLDRLTKAGYLSERGDLPEGAIREVCPTEEGSIALWPSQRTDLANWSVRMVQKIRADLVRHGVLPPLSADPRYTTTKWEGQAVRRIDFPLDDSTQVMVVGLLIPRRDRKVWAKGVPQRRAVHVESSDPVMDTFTWSAERGQMAIESRVAQRVWGCTPEELRKLTLAIAWVCETRAVLYRGE